MNIWEKLKIVSGLIAAVIVPVVIAYVGNNYSSAIKDKELQGRYVELAANILNTQPNEGNKALRAWAIKVINNYSGVPMSEEAKKEAMKSSRFPKLLPLSVSENSTRTEIYNEVHKANRHSVVKQLEERGAIVTVTEQKNGTYKIKAIWYRAIGGRL